MKKYLNLLFPIAVFLISQLTGVFGKHEPSEFTKIMRFFVPNILLLLLPYWIWIIRAHVKKYSGTVQYAGFFAIHIALILMQAGLYKQTQAGDAGMAFYMHSLILCTLASILARQYEKRKVCT